MIARQGVLKRSRSDLSEASNKRSRASGTGGNTTVSARAAGTSPRSPTTSSRSRSRKGGTKKSRERDANAKGATASTAAGRVKASPQNALQGASSRNQEFLKIDGIPISGRLDTENSRKRNFGISIQRMMHGFGDVRFPCLEVVEMTEDIVRNTARNIVFAAAHRAMEDSIRAGKQAPVEGGRIVVTIEPIIALVERDEKLTNRLIIHLYQTDRAKAISTAQNIADRRDRLLYSATAMIEGLSHVPEAMDTNDGSSKKTKQRESARLSPYEDPASTCSLRMHYYARSLMPRNTYHELRECRNCLFLTANPRGQANTDMTIRLRNLRDWLGLSGKSGIALSEEALYAVAHLAWEATGTVTQHALLCKHFESVSRGESDPKASEWGYARHILAALTHGVSTALCIPMTRLQTSELTSELDNLFSLPLSRNMNRWQGFASSYSCLLPRHIRQGVRDARKTPYNQVEPSLGVIESFL